MPKKHVCRPTQEAVNPALNNNTVWQRQNEQACRWAANLPQYLCLSARAFVWVKKPDQKIYPDESAIRVELVLVPTQNIVVATRKLLHYFESRNMETSPA